MGLSACSSSCSFRALLVNLVLHAEALAFDDDRLDVVQGRGETRPGRSSSSRRGKGANPSAARTSRTAVALSGVPCSLRA